MRCLNSNTGLREQGDRQTLRFAVLHGTKDKKPLEEKVPEGRLELPRGCPHWILNLTIKTALRTRFSLHVRHYRCATACRKSSHSYAFIRTYERYYSFAEEPRR
jgi:hypothetical protein